ncbi:Terpene synthase 5 [Euphorbia peplus]|nr:Terpene synthase 5 [Euphorbia peplus]
MAFSTPTIHVTFGVQDLLQLPCRIRLGNKFNCYPSQNSSKIRANIADALTPTNPEGDILRGCLKNCPQSVWGHTFTSLVPLDSELESHSKEVEELKIKVKNMLLHSTIELTESIHFINLLCRLGISYHFEDEINKQLHHIFTMLPKLLEDDDYDLCTLANLFRVLRQYGYNMTSDVFKKFKDKDGEFMEVIANDLQGILSLYEACYLAIPGEDILDEALAFTRKRLETLAENSMPHLQKHIKNSLTCSSRGTIERLDALQYISFYEDDEHVDQMLLKFAKLDYNGLQLLYRKELSQISRWWQNLNIGEDLAYGRDRLVESYVWAVGSLFEPQYSVCRLLITKYGLTVTLMDDTYDSYGTIDELKLLTSALQRFTMEAADELPQSMQPIYRAIFELTKNDETQGCSYKATFAREMFAELARSYQMEKIWQKERKVPSMDEYIKNGKVTSAFDVMTASCILGLEDMGMKEILWIRNNPQTVVGAKLYIRFLNDIVKNETDRGDFPKIMDCYMMEYGVSQDESVEAIRKIVEDLWKKMNDDMLKSHTVPRIFLKYTFNYARLAHIFHSDQGDWFTYAYNLKPLVASLFINPLSM